MTSPTIIRKRAEQILGVARERRVVVLGDVMLDEFIWGDVSRISPEAPVPVVDVKRESTHIIRWWCAPIVKTAHPLTVKSNNASSRWQSTPSLTRTHW